MRFVGLRAARFVARPNRFLVRARLGARLVEAACRDPGRLEGLLRPGVGLRLAAATGATRRTRFDVLLARAGARWVGLAPALANDVFAAALARGEVAGLRGARVLAREVTHGRSRFDFVLGWRGRRTWTEVKSVGLVRDGLALFPDAPSARAARHLNELLALARGGASTQVVFVVQRDDAVAVAPFSERDPDFARALAAAARGGVRVRAYGCEVGPRGIRLARPLPVRL